MTDNRLISNFDREKILGMFSPENDAAKQAATLVESVREASVSTEIHNVLLSMTATSEGSGHYRAVIDIARELKSFGYNVTLLLIQQPSLPLEDEFNVVVKPEIANIEDEASYAAVIDMWAEVIDRFDIHAVVFNQYLAAAKIWHALAIRLVQFTSNRNYIPIYVKVHGVFTRLEDQAREYLAENAPTFNCFDGIIVANTVDAAFWRAYNVNVFVRRLPVDPVVLDTAENDLNSHDVLYLANLGVTKNQLDAIKAMQLVVEEIPDARLVLAGGNTEQYELYYQKCIDYIDAAQDGLSEHICFTGYVQEDEKRRIMNRCSLGISTSRHEGYGVALIEILAAGIPLVVYDLPNCEICTGYEQSGVIGITDKTPQNMAEEIIRVFKDETLHRTLSENARKHAQELITFDYEGFWKDCFALKPTEIEVTQEVQQRIYRVLYNTHHLMVNRNDGLKRRRDSLEERNEKLMAKNEKLDQKLKVAKQRNVELRERIQKLKDDIVRIKESNSYRIGRTITAPVRKIKRMTRK